MNQKEKYYAGVAARAIREISSSVESWTSFLTTMGKNYDFNYPDQVMIHAQRPNATLCMEFDQWKEEKYRYVKRGSKGIALFVTDSERPYLRYVFDVADTGSRRNSRELEKLWKFDDSHRIPIQEAMEKAFGAKKEWNMEMQLQNVAEKLAEEYFSDRRNEMADIVAESFLEGYDELNLEVAFTRAVSTSVAYSLYSRLTDNAEVYFDEEDFRNIFEFNTRKSVNALGTAVSTISTEMFLEIEKTVIAFEQQKEVERSERYDDTDELQQGWGIFDSRDSVTEYRSEAIREVRTNEESVPQGEQTDDLQRHDFDGNTVSTPLGSGRNSEQENGSADEPEKTVVRPTFSYMGDFFISDTVLTDIAICVGKEICGIEEVIKVYENTSPDNLIMDVSVAIDRNAPIWDTAEAFQKRLAEVVELMTAFNVVQIDVQVRDLY